MTDIIRNRIIEIKPNLCHKSVNTYVSILYNLYKKAFGNGEVKLDKFNEVDKFLNVLKEVPASKKKSYLSALVVLTNNDDYRGPMVSSVLEFKDEIIKQKKSEKQEQNWLTQEEIDEKYEEFKNEFEQLITKEELIDKQFQKIQNFIILCLLSGKFFQPRRSMDYTEMKFSDYDLDDDNCLLKVKKNYKMIFNKYKTAKNYGQQELMIPNELKNYLNTFIEISKNKYPQNHYLLIDTNGEKLTSSKLSQRMYKIFGKNASTNMLRHAYVSEKYENGMPSLQELNTDAKAMGHDLEMHLEYIKH